MFDALYALCVEDYEDALTSRRTSRKNVDSMLAELGAELETEPERPDPRDSWGTTPEAIAAQDAFMNLG